MSHFVHCIIILWPSVNKFLRWFKEIVVQDVQMLVAKVTKTGFASEGTRYKSSCRSPTVTGSTQCQRNQNCWHYFYYLPIPSVVKIPRVKNEFKNSLSWNGHWSSSLGKCCVTRWSWSAQQWLKCTEKESWAHNCLLRLMWSFSPAQKRTQLMIH